MTPPRPTTVPAMLAASLILCGPPALAQDEAYEAWTRVFDAIQPDWRGDGVEASTRALDADDLSVLADYASGPPRTPTAREQAALDRLEPLVPLLQAASEQHTFDPGLDVAAGFDILVPHLSVIRQSGRCMKALAHAAAAQGDLAGAAEWTGRIATAAGQVAQDGTLMGSLVGGSLWSIADQQFDWLLGGGLLGPDEIEVALQQMAWLEDVGDPFRVTNAMMLERDMVADELERLAIALESEDRSAMDRFLQILTFDEGDPAGLTAEEVRTQAAMIADIQDRMIAAAADPDRARGLETMLAIEFEIQEGDASVLAQMMIPSLARVLETRARLEVSLFERLEILQAVADGRVDGTALSNAAVLWEKIGLLVESLDGSTQVAGLELIDAVPSSDRLETLVARAIGDAADDLRTHEPIESEVGGERRAEATTRWRTGLEEIAAEIRRLAALAAALPSADFPASQGVVSRYRVVSEDLARLRGAGRALVVDARARMSAIDKDAPAPENGPPVDALFEIDAATDEIVATIALAEDLLLDPALAHVLLATDLLELVDATLRDESTRPVLECDHCRDRLLMALGRVPRRFGFGVAEAGEADLDLFATEQVRWLEGEEDRALWSRIERMSPGEGYALLLAHSGFEARRRDPNAEPPEPITPTEEADDRETGYRPLRLLASLEGSLGPEFILTRSGEARQRILDEIRRLRNGEAAGRAIRASSLPTDRYPLEVRAGNAVNLLADLERFVDRFGGP